MKNKESDKFSVGDCITLSNSELYAIITKVGAVEYSYEIYEKSDGLIVKNWSFDKREIDQNSEHYRVKLANTEITRKLYKGKIYEEEKDYLIVATS